MPQEYECFCLYDKLCLLHNNTLHLSEYKVSLSIPEFLLHQIHVPNGRFSEIQLYLLCFDLGDIFPLKYKHFTNTYNISHQILSNQMKITQMDGPRKLKRSKPYFRKPRLLTKLDKHKYYCTVITFCLD